MGGVCIEPRTASNTQSSRRLSTVAFWAKDRGRSQCLHVLASEQIPSLQRLRMVEFSGPTSRLSHALSLRPPAPTDEFVFRMPYKVSSQASLDDAQLVLHLHVGRLLGPRRGRRRALLQRRPARFRGSSLVPTSPTHHPHRGHQDGHARRPARHHLVAVRGNRRAVRCRPGGLNAGLRWRHRNGATDHRQLLLGDPGN